jgi:predicted heme/steroid binding protein
MLPRNVRTISLFVSVAAFVLAVAYRYTQRGEGQFYPPPTWDPAFVAPRVFTKEELKEKYNGKGGKPAYLVVLGEVYDVSGSEYYAEGSGYSIFVGRDATTAFVTGKFDESADDDVLALAATQMKGIEDWVKFYRCVLAGLGHLLLD